MVSVNVFVIAFARGKEFASTKIEELCSLGLPFVIVGVLSRGIVGVESPALLTEPRTESPWWASNTFGRP